jgi:hypothetical protein
VGGGQEGGCCCPDTSAAFACTAVRGEGGREGAVALTFRLHSHARPMSQAKTQCLTDGVYPAGYMYPQNTGVREG